MLSQKKSEKLESISNILLEIILKSHRLLLREIRFDEAKKCMQLQDSLNESELTAFRKRTTEEYQQMITQGVMLGAFNSEDDELVAQIGTDLSTEKKEYIVSQNATVVKILEESNYVEMGAAIVRADYRRIGLQTQLQKVFFKRIENLIKNQEELEKKNSKLFKLLEKNHSLIVVSGCNSDNFASMFSIMSSSSNLIGIVSGKIVNPNEQPISGFIFAKPIVPTELTNYSTSEETKSDAKKLLEEKTKFEEDEQKKTTKPNPLPLSFVERLLNSGFVLSKNKDDYNLKKPIVLTK